MHRLLYRTSLTPGRGPAADRGAARGAAGSRGRCRADARLPCRAHARHRALSADRPIAPRLAMVAGEASGDLLAALLLAGCSQRWPACAPSASAGRRCRRRASTPGGRSDKLAVRGYADALRHYPRDRRASAAAGSAPAARSAAMSSSASMRPTSTSAWKRSCERAGIKTIHFVCPSIWAWRGGRVKRIARSVDHVLCLFPFEPSCWRAGIAATYVGHPLADVIPLQPPRAEARHAGPGRARAGDRAAARQPPGRDQLHRAAVPAGRGVTASASAAT